MKCGNNKRTTSRKNTGGENSTVSFSDQQQITHDLSDELKSIRTQYRADCAEVEVLVKQFDKDVVDPAVQQEFYDKMRSISLRCSESMSQFASKIVERSVELLCHQPPCDFEVIAIGSIARGEATPYSDLEYIFLIAQKTPETMPIFELLALTTYFIIGNLGETKLSYMAIEELRSWFEDKSKNGFKIDGLLEGAGNIPTGNGSEAKKNHFIVTPQELAERYREVLHNPDPAESIRGDLTAKLTYTKLLYTHNIGASNGGNGLRKQFHESILAIKPNEVRKDANMTMLATDAEKFNFVPSSDLAQKGFNADVKKELYRFPSILLLDICVVLGTNGGTSWDSLQTLTEQGH